MPETLIDLPVSRSEAIRPTKKYYPFIDSFRGIAILWVIALHAQYFFRVNYLGPVATRLAKLGFLGVDFFFVTSGFLITSILIEEYYNGNLNIKRFYARRFFKIVPHYLLTLIAGLGIAAFLIPAITIKPVQAFGYLTLMQSYLKDQYFLLAHLWSISIEEHFYLIYPILLLLIGKLGRTRSEKFTLAIISFCLLFLAGNLSRYLWFYDNSNSYQMTHVRFDALVFGCFICFMQDYFRKRRGLGPIFAVFSLLMLFSFFFYFKHRIWFYYTFAYLAAGSVLAAALAGYRPVIDLGKIGLLRWIGKNSYGIYLWHYILIFPIAYHIGPQRSDWKIVFLYILLSISCGALSTMTFERFCLKLRHQWIP